MTEERSTKLTFDPALSDLVGQLNRLAADGSPAREPRRLSEDSPERGSPPPELAALLEQAIARRAADLFLVVGAPPVLRIEGTLVRIEGADLKPEDIRELVMPVLGRRARQSLLERRVADFAFDAPGIGRFRANVHHERGHFGVCLRSLPTVVPDLESLGLPAPIARLTQINHGLILVVGPAGSGKTTTLAALLARILAARAVHAVTIEEPIEYVHQQGSSLVEQVEIPYDAPSFAAALRAVVRQSPDVLLVGEMRDPETMSAALTAGETGHLVLASVHAYTAPQAIHRLVDAFPAAQQEQVRRQLAVTLAAVVSQRLLSRADGHGRVVAAELLLASDAVRNLVREGRIHNLGQTIAGARAEGMISLEASLAELVMRKRIERDLALRVAYYPEELTRILG